MRTLDRYITKSFLSPFLYCLGIFISLYIIIDLFGHLDEILKHGINGFILLEYYLSMAPNIIMQTSPVASLISSIFVISNMNKHGEIIAMKSSGISVIKVIKPFIYLGLAVSISLFAISEKVLPITMKKVETIKENYIETNGRNKTFSKKIINNIAIYGNNNRLIFIDTFDYSNQTIKGITILQQDKYGNVTSKINAQEGRLIDSKWLLSNILLYRSNSKGTAIGKPVFFKEKKIDLEPPKQLLSKGVNYEFMSFEDLRNYIKTFPYHGPKTAAKLNVQLHQKIGFPFTSLIMILIGAGFSIKINRRHKSSALMGIGMSVFIGFIYYAFMASFIALGKSGILPAFISVHLANVLFGITGILLIRN